MMFNIFKIAAVTLLGWVFVRTFGAVWEQGDEEPGRESAGEDSGVEPSHVEGAQAQPGHTTGAPAEAGAEATQVAQDLRKVRGIGPAIETLLNARGIATWAQLAAAEVSDLQAILEEAGPRYRVHDPSTWPAQAAELTQAN